MSVRKELYNKTSSKLQELALFEWIDLYKGQLNSSNESYPTGFPCAFISVGNINYEDMTMGIQEGQGVLTIYLFFNKGGDTFVDAEDKENSLQILDIIDTVVNAVQWLEGEHFSEITQTGDNDLTERYQRPAYTISFSFLAYNQLKHPSYVPN